MAVLTYLEALGTRWSTRWPATSACSCSARTSATYGGAFKVTEGLIDRFGAARVIDTPISEAAIVGAAIGAAYMGMRPVAEMQFMDFASCAFDMITNFAAKSRYRCGLGVPMVVRGPCGGGVGGGPFHSVNPEAFFLNTPGLQDRRAGDGLRRQGTARSARFATTTPCSFLEHKYLYRRIRDEVPEERATSCRSAARRCGAQGRDVTIVTFGAMVHTALDAASALGAGGRRRRGARSADAGAARSRGDPASVAKTSRALVLYEAPRTGGIGGEIAALIAEEAFEYLDAPVVRLASLDTPVPYSPPLEAAFLPDAGQGGRGASSRLVEY